MLYIIGLGLNEQGMSVEAIEAIKKCEKIFLETYTVDFPYNINKLEKVIGKKIIKVDRKIVESDFLVRGAKKSKIALLVYGSPLFATTHSTLIMDCRKEKIKIKLIYSASVFDRLRIHCCMCSSRRPCILSFFPDGLRWISWQSPSRACHHSCP